MRIIDSKISIGELKEMAKQTFGDLIKAVVDIKKEVMVVDGELHSDEEDLLLQNNSKQENLWGINIYPGNKSEDWIEFDSMINLRPFSGNLTRSVDNQKTRKKIIEIVNKLVEK